MGVRLILKKFLNYADNLSRDYSVFWTGVWSPRLPVGGLPMSEIPRWAAPSARDSPCVVFCVTDLDEYIYRCCIIYLL